MQCFRCFRSKNRKQSERRGLEVLWKVKTNARVMITTNVDLSDRVINGQIGTVKHISINQNEVNVIYAVFDDVFGEQIRINENDSIAKKKKWVIIKREET